MDELMVFQNPEFGEIRTAEVNGEPWFCLADICRPLGLQAKECRRRLKSDGVVLTHLADSMGRPQEMLCVNEANLYRAIFQSHKPEAERFTDWVTEEVLPAIRRTGRYETHPMTMAEQLAAQANLLVAMEQRQDRLEARVDTGADGAGPPKGGQLDSGHEGGHPPVLRGDGFNGRGGPGTAVRRAGAGGKLPDQLPAGPAAGAEEADGHDAAGLHGADEAGRHRRGQRAADSV